MGPHHRTERLLAGRRPPQQQASGYQLLAQAGERPPRPALPQHVQEEGVDAGQASIQTLRLAAIDRGIVVSNEVQEVVEADGVVMIAPASKDQMSVPQYDPVELLAALTPADEVPSVEMPASGTIVVGWRFDTEAGLEEIDDRRIGSRRQPAGRQVRLHHQRQHDRGLRHGGVAGRLRPFRA